MDSLGLRESRNEISCKLYQNEEDLKLNWQSNCCFCIYGFFLYIQYKFLNYNYVYYIRIIKYKGMIEFLQLIILSFVFKSSFFYDNQLRLNPKSIKLQKYQQFDSVHFNFRILFYSLYKYILFQYKKMPSMLFLNQKKIKLLKLTKKISNKFKKKPQLLKQYYQLNQKQWNINS
ncbi:unnamed protein product [Paramecium octaurelia]|uniref:Uncharacterized protein n=1 Tax=Paramecium octaurelia TaxID=43137 RepID=A0A8S1XMS8_PAROT|nr:unnamed protein product [Paramecium octaurelia]